MNTLFKPGSVTVLSIAHDDGCPTIKTQNMNDCTCKEVEQRFVPLEEYAPLNRAARRAAKKAQP